MKLSTHHPPHPRNRPQQSRSRPPRNPSQGQQDPHEPQRTHLPISVKVDGNCENINCNDDRVEKHVETLITYRMIEM
jgi:hypothetical protein